MHESRCGICCGQCPHREGTGCVGCLEMEKPFWGDQCPVKSCCEGRGHAHCGECAAFPCTLAVSFAYDPQQGDMGRRLEQCRAWSRCVAAQEAAL